MSLVLKSESGIESENGIFIMLCMVLFQYSNVSNMAIDIIMSNLLLNLKL
jgi:hypothetical protein